MYGLMTPKRFGGSEAGPRDDDRRDHRTRLGVSVNRLGAHAVDGAHVAAGAVPAAKRRRSCGVIRIRSHPRWSTRSAMSCPLTAAIAGRAGASSRAASITATGSPRRCRSSARARRTARTTLAADSARGLRDRRRLVHGWPQRHREQDHHSHGCLHSRAPHLSNKEHRKGRVAGQPVPCASDVRRDLVGEFHRRDGCPGGRRGARISGGVRGAAALQDGQHRRRADGQYGRAMPRRAAQVDSVHAMTLQNASDSRAGRPGSVTAKSGRSVAATRRTPPRQRARRLTPCGRRAAEAACSRAPICSASGVT